MTRRWGWGWGGSGAVQWGAMDNGHIGTPSPVNKQTDKNENITLPQLHL